MLRTIVGREGQKRLLLACGVVCLTAAACASKDARHDATASKAGKIVAVFIDRSRSTGGERSTYVKAMDRILETIKPGDRFIAAPITERSAKDFIAAVDRELPAPLPPKTLMDNEFTYKKRLAAYDKDMRSFRVNLKSDLHGILDSGSNAMKTAICETLVIAGQIFAADKHEKKVLVLLSDMLEDSSVADFEKIKIDNSFIAKEIARQKSAGLLPVLKDVRVYVAGANANTMERAAAVQNFWLQYFAATQANIDAGRYSRTLLAFDE